MQSNIIPPTMEPTKYPNDLLVNIQDVWDIVPLTLSLKTFNVGPGIDIQAPYFN